jgi:hypothetical protein
VDGDGAGSCWKERNERAVNILIAKIKEEARLWSIVGAKHVSNVMLRE